MNRRRKILGAMGLSFLLAGAAAVGGCDKESDLGGPGYQPPTGGTAAKCPVYTDNASYCACQGWTCGGFTVQDAMNNNYVVYCGQCEDTQYCVPDPVWGAGVGVCGGTSPLPNGFQKQKVNMLISMGENDTPVVQYGYVQNIGDGRGYTIGQAGFTTGTGDFIIVAQCYNMAEPGNILQKYWSAP